MRLSLAAFALAASLSACAPLPEQTANGDDPLAALAAPVQSDRYTDAYWSRTRRRDPKLWADAKAYCDRAAADASPNCAPVRREVFFEKSTATPKPRAGIRPQF